MAKDVPKSPKPARPAKKTAASKAGPKSAKPPKGLPMDDTNIIDNEAPLPFDDAPNDTGPAGTGPTDTGPTDTGTADTGPTDKASATINSLKDNAAAISRTVGEKAKIYAEDGKARAGGALDELAQIIHDAAGTVDEKIGAQYGQYARTAAETVTGFSESLKSKNVDDLIADASGFVKKSPAIAIGAAAALGFVLIRLVQSGLGAETDTDDRT